MPSYKTSSPGYNEVWALTWRWISYGSTMQLSGRWMSDYIAQLRSVTNFRGMKDVGQLAQLQPLDNHSWANIWSRAASSRAPWCASSKRVLWIKQQFKCTQSRFSYLLLPLKLLPLRHFLWKNNPHNGQILCKDTNWYRFEPGICPTIWVQITVSNNNTENYYHGQVWWTPTVKLFHPTITAWRSFQGQCSTDVSWWQLVPNPYMWKLTSLNGM